MGFKTRLTTFMRATRLDSHHAIERFGIFFGVLMLSGVLVVGAAGFSAFTAGQDKLAGTALWTTKFTTSKTRLSGTVDGVYLSDSRTRALIVMHFDPQAKISYNAADYQAFLLGSDEKLRTSRVQTPDITGSFHVFGSTGYVAVMLESPAPFQQQILNLTVRAKAELTFAQQQQAGATQDQVVGDASFTRFDQWRVFANPGAAQATTLPSLDAPAFDPARAYYDVVIKPQETAARAELDRQLALMRSDLTQINTYTGELATTKVDGVSLLPPAVPDAISGDTVTGSTAAESTTGQSTLALNTRTVVPGGFDFNWRDGDVLSGYLGRIMPSGQSSWLGYLQQQSTAGADTAANASNQINSMAWKLSNGRSLANDYRSSDVTMRPLTTLMNNLSQAYQGYYADKRKYESDDLLALLNLEVNLLNVRSGSSANSDHFLTTFH
ncbi:MULTISPECIES: hypothetical protein [Arthrobacter]|uniref:Uncharacterized protein n=1 Tax=Arthrobacter terricola TaxID=2547396 RepID=A0A4R5KA38_9MICC|nr:MULTISPECIES: hypothetical protein [Arthrobacter]MBT8163355.1 hypothetical protein [Arthrobacter sp. GN70]TDF90552.1 hypothetical protein E1809_22090 [Arthrobacter terricola]